MSFTIDSHQTVLNVGGVNSATKKKTSLELNLERKDILYQTLEQKCDILIEKLENMGRIVPYDSAPKLTQDSTTGSDIPLDKKRWTESISKIMLISYLFFTNAIYNIIRYVTMTSVYKTKPSLEKAECGMSDKNSEIPNRSTLQENVELR